MQEDDSITQLDSLNDDLHAGTETAAAKKVKVSFAQVVAKK
jgi:hypothetical protein